MSEQNKGSHELEPYVSTGDAARILGVTHEAVSRKVRKGQLPAIRLGRNWAIPTEALLEFAKTYVKGPGHRKPKAQGRRQT
ncbi:MAG: helix-turn-helix domain-containing protein [Chloroflexi bacterium]|nr:helix-turn-helix domain-containing protein [Chloroflexota bacterium]